MDEAKDGSYRSNTARLYVKAKAVPCSAGKTQCVLCGPVPGSIVEAALKHGFLHSDLTVRVVPLTRPRGRAQCGWRRA